MEKVTVAELGENPNARVLQVICIIWRGKCDIGLCPKKGLEPRIPYFRRTDEIIFFRTIRVPAILDVGCGYGALLYVAQQSND